MRREIYIIVISAISVTSCQRTEENSAFLGEKYARKSLKEALTDTTDVLPTGVPLINDEETAVKFAEVILFKVYGQHPIANERPYEIHNINGYWIIRGTLSTNSLGGTFEIIFNSRDGQIIRSLHYK